jgi:ABC-type multidrug transport system fused ATPase/permease subunit
MKNINVNIQSNKNPNLIKLIESLWSFIGTRRQLQFYLILALTILAAFAETFSLGSLIPFLGVLIAPEKVFESPLINSLALQFGFLTPSSIVFPLTILFISAVILAATLRVLQVWVTTKVTFGCGSDLSIKLYNSILNRSYIEQLSLNSSEIISGVEKIDVAVNVLSQLVRLISTIAILLTVTAALIVIDARIAFATLIFFGSFYVLINLFFKSKVKKNSLAIAVNKTKCLKALQQGIGGIRDISLDGTQAVFCEIYHQADLPLRRAEASNAFIEGNPRFIMESIGIIFIALLAYWLTIYRGGVESSIPLLGVLAMSAQRLLPALQQGYNAYTSIQGHFASLAEVVKLMGKSPNNFTQSEFKKNPLVFEKSIELKKLFFKYPDRADWALNNISLSIKAGSRIGIVGATGSGKSTLMDVIMGLLEPQQGMFLVDGVELDFNSIYSWRSNIAHVPQSIYLIEGSILENIVFGVRQSEFDISRAMQAAKQAQLDEFVRELPLGYQTQVGERGVKLSGGQRQRIGIARALYKEAKILVFDEATSALDNETEYLVLESIQKLDREKTIFMIAHRLSTIQYCDVIYVIQDGDLVDFGSYEELSKKMEFFKGR